MRFSALCCLVIGCGLAFSDEPKKEAASVTATEPASLVSGAKATLKIRGFKLKDASEVRLPKFADVKVEIKEKKDAAQTNGLENKVVGDTQLLAELTLPPEFPPGELEFLITTSVGDATGKISVVSPAATVEEKEPNNGFREAQKISIDQTIRGNFQGEKDVDVYEFSAKAGQKITATVTGGSVLLMDAVLNCYDANGGFLASCDDASTRDPVLTITPAADGPVYFCVSDAHDKGGEWHSYLLKLEVAK